MEAAGCAEVVPAHQTARCHSVLAVLSSTAQALAMMSCGVLRHSAHPILGCARGWVGLGPLLGRVTAVALPTAHAQNGSMGCCWLYCFHREKKMNTYCLLLKTSGAPWRSIRHDAVSIGNQQTPPKCQWLPI